MGKPNKSLRRIQRNENALVQPLLKVLEERAVERCLEGGHKLTFFTAAKKKFGKSVQRAWCERCGEAVMLLPFHEHSKEHRQIPAISGEILFNKCQPR